MSAHARRTFRPVDLVRRYGWRAYALPILSAITVVALVHGVPAPTSTHDAGGNPSAAVAASGTSGARVEGTADAGFAAGAHPAPVVVTLAPDSTSCLDNRYPKLLIVSVRRQHLWACERHRQVASTPVTTGRSVDHDETPLGSWRVQAKQRDRYLIGRGYKDYVHYWVPFNGDFGLHDASWQTMPFGSPGYPTWGSHGCVHLPTPMMSWLYHWTSVGGTVVTIEA